METAEATRLHNYSAALSHWFGIGYTYDTARALAAVLHGQDEDVKIWANNIRQTQTNLRYEDMI